MSPSLAVQKALAARLVDDPAITALVAAQSGKPEHFPSILIGEDQEIPIGDLNRRTFEVYSTLHVWTRESGMTEAKVLASAVRSAVLDDLPAAPGIAFRDVRFESARYLRDPSGDLAHGVVTLCSIVEITS